MCASLTRHGPSAATNMSVCRPPLDAEADFSCQISQVSFSKVKSCDDNRYQACIFAYRKVKE